MRRFVVALAVAMLALTLAACGGGGEGETTEGTDTAVPVAPTAEAPAGEPEYVTDRSINDSDFEPYPFPAFTSTSTPSALQDKLDDGRPMLIFFYDPAQDVTKATRVEIDAVMKEYRGLIDLVTFNIGDTAGQQAAETAVTYANELGIDGTPYTIVVDDGGYVTWRWKGFAERGYLTREVERATR